MESDYSLRNVAITLLENFKTIKYIRVFIMIMFHNNNNSIWILIATVILAN
jgi:hypothetical protein